MPLPSLPLRPDVEAILRLFGFTRFHVRGSHAKLRRLSPHGHSQTLVVPLHREIDKGTLQANFRQASRYIDSAELEPHFFTHD
jgi:predicted RNA binding protein YcfA (HicA-like mRNA interferase family)